MASRATPPSNDGPGVPARPIAPATPQRTWRDLSKAELDAAYDNSAAVAESADWLQQWNAHSAALRARKADLLDQRYGPLDRNRIDIFRSGAVDAPLFVFIHGGYWQRNCKDIFSCMAGGLLAHGIDVALPGYTLAPDASLTQIVGEIHAAVRWLRASGPVLGVAKSRLIVSGWSAGGHLAATCMSLPEVDAGLAISGIFALEPIARTYLNTALRLTAEEIAGLSPIHHPPATSAPLTLAWGLAELPELQRQSRDLAAIWGAAGIPCATRPIAGANHFTILNELARPDGALTQLALPLLHKNNHSPCA